MALDFPKTSSSFLMSIFGLSSPWVFSRSLFLLSLQNPGEVVNSPAVQQCARSFQHLVYIWHVQRERCMELLHFLLGLEVDILWSKFFVLPYLAIQWHWKQNSNPKIPHRSSPLTCSIGTTWLLRTLTISLVRMWKESHFLLHDLYSIPIPCASHIL